MKTADHARSSHEDEHNRINRVGEASEFHFLTYSLPGDRLRDCVVWGKGVNGSNGTPRASLRDLPGPPIIKSRSVQSEDCVGDRPRILVLGDENRSLARIWPEAGIGNEHVSSLANALDLLRRERFDAVVLDPASPRFLEELRLLLNADRILLALPDGVALIDNNGLVRWANRAFLSWCDGVAVGRDFQEALGATSDDPDLCPVRVSLDSTASLRLRTRSDLHLEIQLTPVSRADGTRDGAIVLARDIGYLVYHEKQLAILRQASQILTAIPAEDLADLGVPQRVELLTQYIRRCIHDLLHYEQIEIRLLDPATNRLEPLLQEGMTPEAMGRVLSVAEKGQGVTGRVAATRRGYLCPDTARDPLYLKGGQGCRSSMTVPLLYNETLVGTINVESPRLNAFTPADLHFLELFGREIANALHTLELLNAEKQSAVSSSIEAVRHQVALPVDEILAAATTLLERYIGHEPEMSQKLRQIMTAARSVRQVIQKIGDNVAPPTAAGPGGPPLPSVLRGMRILVADSDERVRLLAHNILGRWGCIVETARDGQEAVTMARLNPYDAILTDIRLPDMTGYDAYREFRQTQPLANVILMTGYGYDPTHAIVKARTDGLRHVLFKPFRVDQLITALADPAPDPIPKPSPS